MRTEAGALSTQQVFGKNVSLMVARRSAGYRSLPHAHDCEQLNFVSDGAVEVHVDGEVFQLEQGDFLRIPAGAVHWAWNRGDSDCLLFEVHAPGLEILPEDATVDLLDDGEEAGVVRVPLRWVPEDGVAAS
jgi:quercetin dioxygenase-like cupin family protein